MRPIGMVNKILAIASAGCWPMIGVSIGLDGPHGFVELFLATAGDEDVGALGDKELRVGKGNRLNETGEPGSREYPLVISVTSLK